MRLPADLMPIDACFGRVETSFPSADRHFPKVRFEEASFQGVDFRDLLECSLRFALRSSDETMNPGFF
jgi:hypothetical protein